MSQNKRTRGKGKGSGRDVPPGLLRSRLALEGESFQQRREQMQDWIERLREDER